MSHHWRRADKGDDGGLSPLPVPRSETSSRSPQSRQMARQASDGMMSPLAAPARRVEASEGRKDDMKSAHARLSTTRKKESLDTGALQPPSSSNRTTKIAVTNPKARSGMKQSGTSGTKKVVIRPTGTSAKKQPAIASKTQTQASSTRGQTPSSSPISAMKGGPATDPSSPSRKGSVGLTEKPPVQRKAVKFGDVHPAKGGFSHRKPASKPQPLASKPPSHPEKIDSPQKKPPPAPKPTPSTKPPSDTRSSPRKEKEDDGKGATRRNLKRHSSNSSLIEDRDKLETRWKWTKQSVTDAFKPYLKTVTENDDALPDLNELDAYDCGDDDEEQHFMDEIRDQMLDDGQLPEREIAVFFLGFDLLRAKVKSLESQLKSAKTMAFHRIAPKTTATSNGGMARTISDFGSPIPAMTDVKRSTSLEGPRILSKDDRGLSCKLMSIKRIQHDPKTSLEHQRLLKELEEAEKKQKKLEKQIKQAGLQIAEDIPYEEAKKEVAQIAARMQEIGSSEVTHEDKAKQAELRAEYYELEQKMEKFSTALMLSDEYIQEQEGKEMAWEAENEAPNNEALKKLRRHMPIAVKSMSEAQLCSQQTPNGKTLPRAIARKFKRTNVLQLIRTNPEEIYRMHAATLENMRVAGMTLTERRAMYAHIKELGNRWKAMQPETMAERKWTWFNMMRANLKEAVSQYDNHVEKFGPPGNHSYSTRDNPDKGCPLIGKQCPLRADQQPSYDNDYGFPEEAEYEETVVRKSDTGGNEAKAVNDAVALARERRANERTNALKKHYKGVLQVSKASASCEAMDEALETMESLQIKWIENGIALGYKSVPEDEKRKEMRHLSDALNNLRLSVSHFAERSGMQLTGKRDANVDIPDIRSAVEIGLCEDVIESASDFFSAIKQRMKQLSVKDRRMKVSIEQLQELLDELHERNTQTLERLKAGRPAPSRKRKTREAMTKEVKEKLQVAAGKNHASESGTAVSALPGRDDLKSAITGIRRGTGGADAGKSDLMAAILARRSNGGKSDDHESNRGALAAAIASKAPGKSGKRISGGRGNFLAEIQAKAAAREAAAGDS